MKKDQLTCKEIAENGAPEQLLGKDSALRELCRQQGITV